MTIARLGCGRSRGGFYAQLAAERPGGRVLGPREQLREIYVQNREYIRANPDWGGVLFLEIWPSVAIGEARIRRVVDTSN